jgi:DNA-binding NarL/FixJ family response regulator
MPRGFTDWHLEALALHCSGSTHREIAQELGKCPILVRKTIYRTKRRLRGERAEPTHRTWPSYRGRPEARA